MSGDSSSWYERADGWYWRAVPWLAPGLLNSQHHYASELRRSVTASRRWLDLGCGHEFLPPWLGAPERSLDLGQCSVYGIDADRVSLSRHRGLDRRVCGDVQVLPFRDGSFDLVTANMVVEHVARPEGLFREVHRVLTANGRFVVHTPNRAGYSTALTRVIPNEMRGGLARVLLQRDERDVYPTFYRANRERDLRRMAQQSGLTMVECQYLESSAQTIAVPPLMVAELLLVRALRVLRAARFRPCLLATFAK